MSLIGELSQAVMKLPGRYSGGENDPARIAYLEGHLDARADAAEFLITADALRRLEERAEKAEAACAYYRQGLEMIEKTRHADHESVAFHARYILDTCDEGRLLLARYQVQVGLREEAEGKARRLMASHAALLAAAKAWVDYFDRLGRDEDPGDPLAIERRRVHGPRVEATRDAVRAAEGK